MNLISLPTKRLIQIDIDSVEAVEESSEEKILFDGSSVSVRTHTVHIFTIFLKGGNRLAFAGDEYEIVKNWWGKYFPGKIMFGKTYGT